MIVRFWGTRGSIPAPGPSTLHFGGNTSCVEVRCGDLLLVLDGGTGIRPLGESLWRQGVRNGILLFTHVHWDHIQGFPFFLPAYDRKASFEILGGEEVLESLEATLGRQMRPPNFPVRLKDMGAEIKFRAIREGEHLVRGGVDIQVIRLVHPDPTYGYRIRHEGATLVYATDMEHPAQGVDGRLAEFSRRADLLIYDAQYTVDEYLGISNGRSRKGWGHSTAQDAARLALESEVGQLALFHYDPSHDDELIRGIEREARAIFPNTFAAYEGLELHLGRDKA
jgi:phosphoribosyl 1,2-cyclic phosphodiesterase